MTEWNDEDRRIAVNFEMAYDNWLKRSLPIELKLSYNIKTVGGKEYLYSKNSLNNKESSLGLFDDDLKSRYEIIKQEKIELETYLDEAEEHLSHLIEQFKILKIPKIDKTVGKILRQLDKSNLLETYFLVVGTFAFFTYGVAAGIKDKNYYKPTLDLDFAWARKKYLENNEDNNTDYKSFLYELRKVDKSFNMNHRKSYQSTNSKGFEVELLCAPSSMSSLLKEEKQFRPISTIVEQEWLLRGNPIRHVLLDEDNLPTPIVAPDPRWMALHKIWLSGKPSRDPRKVEKDKKQGFELLNLVTTKLLSSYPIDINFVQSLPPELKTIMGDWCSSTGYVPPTRVKLKL